MAITSRDLQPPAARRVFGSSPWQRRFDALRPYLQPAGYILVAYLLVHLLMGRGQTLLDDMRYGRPRTEHLTGMVGHHETTGEPTHFIAMNLNRRVVVMELPGGDVTKAQMLQGPYLFGANEDLTPVRLRLHDMNGDKKDDLVVSVKKEQIIYINAGENFRLINADERRALDQVP